MINLGPSCFAAILSCLLLSCCITSTLSSISVNANGGHFRYGSVSWKKMQQQPPVVEFTIEAVFRRDYSSANFKGSGTDGLLVSGDRFKPSGYETIMFDFGDGTILMPMTFVVEGYSIQEDWIYSVATFQHTYPLLLSTTAFSYTTTFKGCCRHSDLVNNAHTSWILTNSINVRDDGGSPQLSSIPVHTVVKKARPSDADPHVFIPAGKVGEIPGGRRGQLTWRLPSAIGAATLNTEAPRNLASFQLDSSTGKMTILAGPVYDSDNPSSLSRCDVTKICSGNMSAGLYDVVVEVREGNSTATLEFAIRLVELQANEAIPNITTGAQDIFYPAFSSYRNLGYVGFSIPKMVFSSSTSMQGMGIGFSFSRLPPGAQLSVINGGRSVSTYVCSAGSGYCRESTGTACNQSSSSCTCLPPDTGKVCNPAGSDCHGGSQCSTCWSQQACPTPDASIELSWTPSWGQDGVTVICVNAIAKRNDPTRCVEIEVFKDTRPVLWSSYSQDLDPYSNTTFAYVGRVLSFTLYANDTNCFDSSNITMGSMPPGAFLDPQGFSTALVPMLAFSSIGVADGSTRACPTQHVTFHWNIPITYGGYKGRHCFYATVAKCKYAVSMEQTIAEIAAIFGTDWIQIFNLNAMTSPDIILFRHQVLNVGHLYSVAVGDSLDSIARRFGTSPRSIMFLNYELGELNSTNITVGNEICIIANSCFGEIQSFWDQNPKPDQSLERWYADVMAAYNELRRAKAAALASSGALPPV
ncbi:hypothetical protein GUITHDRAFT_148849 [Guillardia theta CCMP2712]|uniref:LysM domain-containing protein n=1 Tax=Guillardia theta (strain CCMP2712) TaxID=905079 RepID=L1I765_GUITC|nr:hypothetical protein GUITHDRAFT_148849 [Guillardia theta CCMP2712]EKX32098.1 hypothetical protein GUITHDRAFT_148849 [Guillardia theta CCMP2712]|eukprot:XP_005819078.1 hypothetical protein GUITHDRAFT_148849 [Guillardia theta CCMP2712]